MRTFVVPGSVPLQLSHRTLTSIGTVINFVDHTLRTPSHRVALTLSSAGHLMFNALGAWGVTNLPETVLVTSLTPPSSDDDENYGSPASTSRPEPSSAGAATQPGAGRSRPVRAPILTGATTNMQCLLRKLHVQCGHSPAERMCYMLRAPGVADGAVFSSMRSAVGSCVI